MHAAAGGPFLRLWLRTASARGHLHGHEGGRGGRQGPRNPKESQGIPRNPKESQGIPKGLSWGPLRKWEVTETDGKIGGSL